jgi:hypothetical protein
MMMTIKIRIKNKFLEKKRVGWHGPKMPPKPQKMYQIKINQLLKAIKMSTKVQETIPVCGNS